MHDRQGLEVGLEGIGESVVGLDLGDVEGVAARGGCLVQEEGGQTRRLLLIRHVRVKPRRRDAVALVVEEARTGDSVLVDEVELWDIFRLTRDRVDV